MEPRLLLLDANVLLGLTDLNLDGRRATIPALRRYILQGYEARCLTGQLREVYVVLTRLGQNGYEVSPARAAQTVRDLADLVPVIAEPPETFTLWREMIVRGGTVGIRAHDEWIVATARCLGATLLTDDRRLAASAEVPTLRTEGFESSL